jgi:hypothetical protein
MAALRSVAGREAADYAHVPGRGGKITDDRWRRVPCAAWSGDPCSGRNGRQTMMSGAIRFPKFSLVDDGGDVFLNPYQILRIYPQDRGPGSAVHMTDGTILVLRDPPQSVANKLGIGAD